MVDKISIPNLKCWQILINHNLHPFNRFMDWSRNSELIIQSKLNISTPFKNSFEPSSKIFFHSHLLIQNDVLINHNFLSIKIRVCLSKEFALIIQSIEHFHPSPLPPFKNSFFDSKIQTSSKIDKFWSTTISTLSINSWIVEESESRVRTFPTYPPLKIFIFQKTSYPLILFINNLKSIRILINSIYG